MCSPSALKNSTAVSPPQSQRFPQSRRLRKKAEFDKVYAEGARLGGSLFVAFCRTTGTAASAKVGLAVPRSLGKAVTRNRVKRRVREAVRRHWPDLPPGLEVVIHARRRLADADWPELEAEIVRTFRKAARLTDAHEPHRRPSRSA